MTDLITRNYQKSLAKTILLVEKELGIPLDAADTLEVLNDFYGYVKKGDDQTLETLKKQVELDVAAEKHAANNKISRSKLSKVAIIRTTIDRELGTLTNHIRKPIPE